LTWPYDELLPRPKGYFDAGLRECAYWTVEGDSIENLSVDYPGHEGLLFKIGPNKWGIRDDHGRGSDLVRVRGLKKVTIEGYLGDRPIMVGTNAEYIIPEELGEAGTLEKKPGGDRISCKSYDFVDVITDKDTPLSFPQGVRDIITPENVAIGAGIAGGAAAVTKALDWW